MPASNAACRYHSRLGRSGAGFSRMSSWAHDHSRKLGVNLSEPRPRAKNAIGLAIPTAKVSEN